MKFTKFGQIYTHNIIVILITFKCVITTVLNKIICMKYNIEQMTVVILLTFKSISLLE